MQKWGWSSSKITSKMQKILLSPRKLKPFEQSSLQLWASRFWHEQNRYISREQPDIPLYIRLSHLCCHSTGAYLSGAEMEKVQPYNHWLSKICVDLVHNFFRTPFWLETLISCHFCIICNFWKIFWEVFQFFGNSFTDLC